MKSQELQLPLKKSPEIIGEKSDQLHWSDVWKNGQTEFILSNFTLMEFQDGSNINKPVDTLRKMMKLKVKNQT